ncbi:HAD-IB family hydrolase [Marinomonas gallaica]|uniref:HAD-IB family hydrolase n=1 Tax=Marinomonas gallaica TaxID=1806667 RepID=UPI003A8D8A94
MSQKIAFFDFDGTLTLKDSLLPFLKYVRGRERFYLDMLQVSPWLAGYVLRIVPNDIAKSKLLSRSLAGMLKSELCKKGQTFCDGLSDSALNQMMVKRLKEHQAKGHMTVLVSASLDVYLDDWAQKMGFDACLCSRLEQDKAGYVTGRFMGENCYGDEKVHRIERFLSDTVKPIHSYAYGDTLGDLAMLEYVHEGYWVSLKGIQPI